MIVNRPRLLDLFCGAGGAAMGYYRAGFEVVGVGIKPQPHYPFEFHQADALSYPLEGFDAYHASPPCQKFSAITTARHNEGRHVNLIPAIRTRLEQTGVAYVIENVPRSPLVNPMKLCGTMFGLHIIRHRLFETKPAFYFRTPCQCKHQHTQLGGKHGFLGRTYQNKKEGYITVVGSTFSREVGAWAMGIDWMTTKEMSQAIPPVYTYYIGKYLLNAITETGKGR